MDFTVAAVVACALATGTAFGAGLIWRHHRRVVGELTKAMRVDPLTGLGNRAALNLLYHNPPVGEQAIVAILDLDGFKRINDEQGHDVGDAALVEVAYRLRSAVGPDAYVFRSSNRGDEFIVIRSLPHSVLVTEATVIAEAFGAELHAAIEGGWKVPAVVKADEPVLYLHASVGVTSGDPGRLPELLRAADEAMYEVKAARVLNEDGTYTGPDYVYRGPIVLTATTRPRVRLRDTRPGGPRHRAQDRAAG